MGMLPPQPSALDASAGESNPRREEIRALGLRGGPWRYGLIALAIIAVVVGLFWFASRTTESPMPDLVGMPIEDAIGEIADNDRLCLGVVRRGTTGEPGTVTRQQPADGIDLSESRVDWEVQLRVAPGIPRERAKQLVRTILEGPACEGARTGLLDLS
jgi:beta-lactam-binding protein with PASTA domain